MIKNSMIFPTIISTDTLASMKLYVELFDYKLLHQSEYYDGDIITLVNDRDERIDIIPSSLLGLDKNYYSIRINVENFDEAIRQLNLYDCKLIGGPVIKDSTKSGLVEDVNGSIMYIVEHMK